MGRYVYRLGYLIAIRKKIIKIASIQVLFLFVFIHAGISAASDVYPKPA